MFPEVHERHCGLSGDTATCLLNHALQPECLKRRRRHAVHGHLVRSQMLSHTCAK